MSDRRAIPLEHRGVLAVTGEDARAFLQGLTSNDVNRVAADRALWSALLTPQGRFLFEFFMVEHDGALLLECETARRDDLLRKLSMYKLRSKVGVAKRDDLSVFALIGEGSAPALGLPDEAGAA
ncbi:MAG: folate-binding protein, partial [Alphaproteobacteria bacterium]|nr:folate-binding protein [Alphaproteobacteria bacterium]